MQAKTDFSSLIKLLKAHAGKHVVMCDENTFKHCYEPFCALIEERVHPVVIKAGEVQKSVSTCEFIWQKLIELKADKDALLLNLGGGVVSDIGGFAAATFKRGISYVNVPTTLLAMVDAASGGKTGINFSHLKNSIGIIQQPELVVIHTPFLNTLPPQHLKNGFAEMLKHALLSGSEAVEELLASDDLETQLNEKNILKSLAVKEAIVAQDPSEKGLRKILNFGHTVGHAIEFAALDKGHEILHGEAVALGMIAALKLSVLKLNFNMNDAESIIKFIRNNYPTAAWIKDNYNTILEAIVQDKKNSNQEIKLVLLEEVGKPVYDIPCSLQEIEAVLMEV